MLVNVTDEAGSSLSVPSVYLPVSSFVFVAVAVDGGCKRPGAVGRVSEGRAELEVGVVGGALMLVLLGGSTGGWIRREMLLGSFLGWCAAAARNDGSSAWT